MLVFVASDKGGTGRSVTSCNMAYRSALKGRATCYLDFDFGSPTAGSVFNIPDVPNGTTSGKGLHSYLLGKVGTAEQLDIWDSSDRPALRERPPAAANLVLLPGDAGGGEFRSSPDIYRRCGDLFQKLDEQFEVIFVDLSAGRSYATEIVLAATAEPNVQRIDTRWLVFHRWTRQHVRAAASLVHGTDGILSIAENNGHKKTDIEGVLRFVRTAVINANTGDLNGLRPAQVAFLRECDGELLDLSMQLKVGRTRRLGSVPLEPLLQWREQLISDNDVYDSKIANMATVTAFEKLADDLFVETVWGVV